MSNIRLLWPILAAVFLDMVGFGMIIPDIQLRAEAMGANGLIIGAILASTFVIQTLTSQLWGRLSDRIGRKSVFVACTAISALSMLVYGLAPTLLFILGSRLLAGLGAANVAAAQASAAQDADGLERADRLGKMSAVLSVGLIVGPALGGFVSHHLGSMAVGLIGAGLSFLGAATVLVFGKFTQGKYEPPAKKKFEIAPLLRDFPTLIPLVIVTIVAWFSLAMLEGTFGRLIKATLGLGSQEFGFIFAFESVLGFIIQAFLFKSILKRIPSRWSLPLGYLFQGFGLAITPLAPTFGLLFVASGFYALGSSVAGPTLNSMCSEIVPEERQGELFGLLQSARGIGFVVGPILGGQLFDFSPPMPYYFAGVVCAVSAAIIFVSTRRHPQPALT